MCSLNKSTWFRAAGLCCLFVLTFFLVSNQFLWKCSELFDVLIGNVKSPLVLIVICEGTSQTPCSPLYIFYQFPCFRLSFFPPALPQCELGELVCEGPHGCIPLQKRCDRSADCLPFHSDESSCHGNMFLHTLSCQAF